MDEHHPGTAAPLALRPVSGRATKTLVSNSELTFIHMYTNAPPLSCSLLAQQSKDKPSP